MYGADIISPLWTAMPLEAAEAGGKKSISGTPFQHIFETAVEAVKETDAEKVKAEYLLATGQLDNPAALTIASAKAGLSVDLLVQLRNKALDAYSELMRISL